MTINQIRTFLDICEAGNLSRAAEDGFISVQALSRTVTSLEKELKVKLFLRTPSGVKLTREGEVAYAHFREVVRQLDSLPDAFLDSAQALHEKVSLCLAYGVFKSIGKDLFPAFRQKYPNIELKFEDQVDSVAEERLAQGAIDILLSCGPYEHEHYTSLLVKSERMYSIIHKDHPLYGKTFTLEEMLDYDMLVMPEDFRYRLPVVDLENKYHKPVKCRFCSYQFELLKEMAESNQGIFTIPESSIPPASPDVEYVPFPDPSYTWNIYMTIADGNRNPAAWAFFEYATEKIRQVHPR